MEKRKILFSMALLAFVAGCGKNDISSKPLTDENANVEVQSSVEIMPKEQDIVIEESLEPTETKEMTWAGKSVFVAPERPSLPENIEILDVQEGLSDFSLLITFRNNGDKDFPFINDYSIDVNIDGIWYEYTADSGLRDGSDYVLASGETKTMAYEMWYYSQLPDGEYRITTPEGITGEFRIDKSNKNSLQAVGEYPDRTTDEIYQSLVNSCTDFPIDYSGEYIFEKRGFHDIFYMIFSDNHSYQYYEGLASSYLGEGIWEIEGDEIVLRDNSSYNLCNYFLIEDNVLSFEAEKSTGFIYTVVLDGDRFICDRNLWEETIKDKPDQRLLYR